MKDAAEKRDSERDKSGDMPKLACGIIIMFLRGVAFGRQLGAKEEAEGR